jgi:aspartate-semialdehyde dehydrogenase
MSNGYNVAVVGATGAVGVEMIRTLQRRNFPVRNLRLFASERSVGKTLQFRGEPVKVEQLGPDVFGGIDFALFSAGASRSKEFAPHAVRAGAVVIDNSSAFRLEPEVPLVVPEVNPEDAKKHNGIIANPNCSTAIMVVVVYPLHRVNPVRRIVVATYQAASGAGARAMAELEQQTAMLLRGDTDLRAEALPQRIAFNLFPHVDVFLENGYTKEEMKFVHESRKIMHAPDLMVSATCVRVPVYRAHSEAVNLEFERPMSADQVRDLLAKAPGVKLVDDPARKLYPMPVDASGQDDVLVGRIRQDCSRTDGRGIALFVSGDQLLKGAALNAVQIAELLIQ